MKNGIYIDPHTFVDFSESTGQMAFMPQRVIMDEIATRGNAWDYSGLMGLLPDPDPILEKLGYGPEVLESLTSDGHLCGVIQQRKLGTLKKEHKWEPGSAAGEEPTPQAKKLCEQLVEDMKEVDVYNLMSALLDTPLYGMQPLEIIWKRRSDRIGIADIRALPSRWFGFDEENNPRFVSRSNPWGGEGLPWGKFVVARHFPTYDNPYGLRLLSRCFWPVAFKKGGIKFWLTFAEKYGMPFMLGKYRQGASDTEQTEMLDRLTSMCRSAVAVIADGGSVEMLNQGSGKGSSADIYKGLKDAMDHEMSKVIVGQTLTSEPGEGGGGSYGLGKQHGETLEDIRAGDQKLIVSVMERISSIYAVVNGLHGREGAGVEPPSFSWFEEDDPKKDFAERDKVVSETGVRFKKGYYVRQYGYKEDDFEIQETVPDLRAERSGAVESGLYPSGHKSPASKEEEKEFAEPRHTPGTVPVFTQYAKRYAHSKFEGQSPRFTPQQQAVEDLVDKVFPRGAAALEGNEKLLTGIIEKAGSYDEAFELLLEAYPELEMEDMEELLFRAGLNSSLFGRWTVLQEGHNDREA